MRNNLILLAVFALFASCSSKSSEAEKMAKTNDTISVINQGDVAFTDFFSQKTMRFDYYHTGSAISESFAIDQVVSDGVWSGSCKILIDKLELGPYFF